MVNILFCIIYVILVSFLVKRNPEDFPQCNDAISSTWCALGCRSFYFPSISFLSGFPSAFPLILKQEHSLARAVSKRVAVVFQAAHDSVEVPTGKDESGSLKDHGKEGLKELVFHLDLLELPI